jgi:hypothetical protein
MLSTQVRFLHLQNFKPFFVVPFSNLQTLPVPLSQEFHNSTMCYSCVFEPQGISSRIAVSINRNCLSYALPLPYPRAPHRHELREMENALRGMDDEEEEEEEEQDGGGGSFRTVDHRGLGRGYADSSSDSSSDHSSDEEGEEEEGEEGEEEGEEGEEGVEEEDNEHEDDGEEEEEGEGEMADVPSLGGLSLGKQGAQGQGQGMGTQGQRTQVPFFGARKQGMGTQNQGMGTQNQGMGTQGLTFGTYGHSMGTQPWRILKARKPRNQKQVAAQGTQNQGMGTQGHAAVGGTVMFGVPPQVEGPVGMGTQNQGMGAQDVAVGAQGVAVGAQDTQDGSGSGSGASSNGGPITSNANISANNSAAPKPPDSNAAPATSPESTVQPEGGMMQG